MKTMISVLRSEYSKQHNEHYPISSTYLVMLRRYQAYLHDNDPAQIELSHSRTHNAPVSNEYIENTISVNQLAPIFCDLEKTCGHKAFGIDIGCHMHPSDYGIFGYAMMNCSSVGLALETAARYKMLRNQNMEASFYRSGGQYVYQINTLKTDSALQILVELDVSNAFQFGKLLVGPHRSELVKLNAVHFTHAPLGPVELYEERFGCPVYFEQEKNCVFMSDSVTTLPIYAANPKVLSVLESKIQAIVSRTQSEEVGLSKRVYGYLNNISLSTFPSASQVAESFNMSLSSFKKYLKDEGTCFQELCEEARKERSFKLLAQQDLAIKTIAFELGFANPSAFNRAFKRWTGNSPLGYRKAKEETELMLY